jgi:hypothetical protein
MGIIKAVCFYEQMQKSESLYAPTDRNNPTDKKFASVGLFLSVGKFSSNLF